MPNAERRGSRVARTSRSRCTQAVSAGPRPYHYTREYGSLSRIRKLKNWSLDAEFINSS